MVFIPVSYKHLDVYKRQAEDLERAGAVSVCRDLEEVERVVIERY